MSLIHVEYNDKTFTYTVNNPALLVNELFEKACMFFSVHKLHYKLVSNNKQRQPIDRSQPVRLLVAQKQLKLSLVEQKHRSDQVNVTLEYNNQTHNIGTVHCDTTLYDLLIKLEQPPYNYSLFDVTGVPPVESNANYTVHINIPSLMQPTIEYNQRKYGYQLNHNGNAELKQTTLASLGLRSDTMQPTRIKCKVRLEYIAPKTSDIEKQQIIAQFEQRFAARQQDIIQQHQQQTDAMVQHIEANIAADNISDNVSDVISNSTSTSSITTPQQPPATQSTQSGGEQAYHYDTSVLPKPGEIRTDIPGVTIVAPTAFKRPLQNTNISEYTQSTALHNSPVVPEPIIIPAHRNRRIFYAPPGSVKVDDLPDEFFELSDEDVAVYARGLLSQMTLSQGNQALVQQLKEASKPGKQISDYNKSLIRFRLPNHLFIEALFKPTETIGDMRTYLNDILHSNVLSTYYLYITPPRTKLEINKQTLKSHGLVSMCIVNVHVQPTIIQTNTSELDMKTDTETDVGHGIIRDDLLPSILYLPRQDDMDTVDTNTNPTTDKPKPIVPVELD